MEGRTMKAPLKVCVATPCYNEEGVITYTVEVLLKELDSMAEVGLASPDSYICCVDDGGSRDGTWPRIGRLAATNKRVRGIKLSANFGHPNALIAGLFSNHNEADILDGPSTRTYRTT